MDKPAIKAWRADWSKKLLERADDGPGRVVMFEDVKRLEDYYDERLRGQHEQVAEEQNSPGMQALIAAIDTRSREIYEGGGDDGDDAGERADAKDLARALARILAGQTLRAAFGSPGDWGYSTAIGKALAKAYQEGDAQLKVTR